MSDSRKVEDQWPKRGDLMRFLGENGYDHQLEQAKKLFIVGRLYTVRNIAVGSFDHRIEFEEVSGSYNGVMFEWVKIVPARATPSPSPVGVDAMREALDKELHAWIRNDLPTGLKMMLLPEHCDALIDRLSAALASAPQSVPAGAIDEETIEALGKMAGAAPEAIAEAKVLSAHGAYTPVSVRSSTVPAGTRDDGIEAAAKVADENSCPGHVASAHDPKVCGRCGVHIDSLRPDDGEE